MNVYINVDIEGISGVYCTEQQIPGDSKYKEAWYRCWKKK